MSAGFNSKSPAALVSSKRVSLSFEARHHLLLFSYESPTWYLIPVQVHFIYIENLLLCAPIFISYLRWSGQLAAASITALGASLCALMFWRQLLTTDHMHQSLLHSHFSSALLSPFSVFTDLKSQDLALDYVTQRHKIRISSWKNSLNRLAQHRAATNLQFVKYVLSVDPNKMKCNKVCLYFKSYKILYSDFFKKPFHKHFLMI